jgi:hypothetical protein
MVGRRTGSTSRRSFGWRCDLRLHDRGRTVPVAVHRHQENRPMPRLPVVVQVGRDGSRTMLSSPAAQGGPPATATDAGYRAAAAEARGDAGDSDGEPGLYAPRTMQAPRLHGRAGQDRDEPEDEGPEPAGDRDHAGAVEDERPVPPLNRLPCGHPLAARAIRYMNERFVTVCWACAVESGLTPLYPGTGGRTIRGGSDATSRVAGGAPLPPRRTR